MGFADATQGYLGVHVDAVDASGEVHGEASFVDSDDADHGPTTHVVTDDRPCLGEMRVRRLDPAVIDGHRAVADHDADE